MGHFVPVLPPGTKASSLLSRKANPGSKIVTNGPVEPGQKTVFVVVDGQHVMSLNLSPGGDGVRASGVEMGSGAVEMRSGLMLKRKVAEAVTAAAGEAGLEMGWRMLMWTSFEYEESNFCNSVSLALSLEDLYFLPSLQLSI